MTLEVFSTLSDSVVHYPDPHDRVTFSRVLSESGWAGWPASTHLNIVLKSSTQTNDLLFKQAALEDERLEELNSWLPFPQLPKPGAFKIN